MKAYISPAIRIEEAVTSAIIAESIHVGGSTDATGPNETKDAGAWVIWDED